MIISILNTPAPVSYKQFHSFKKLVSRLIDECHPDDHPGSKALHSGDKELANIHGVLSSLGFIIEILPYKDIHIEDRIFPVEYHNPLPFKDRNRALVDLSDIIIALPTAFAEYDDSPVGKTINYAVARDKEVYGIGYKGTIYEIHKGAGREGIPEAEEKWMETSNG